MTQPPDPHTPSWAAQPPTGQQPVVGGPPPPPGYGYPPPQPQPAPGFLPPPGPAGSPWGQPWGAPQPAPSGGSQGKRAAIGCAAVAGFAIFISVVAAAIGSDGSTHPAAASPAASSADGTAAAATGGTPTDNSATDDPATSADNTKAAIYSWYTGGGQEHVNNIIKDTSDIGSSASLQDSQGVADGCTTLSSDIGDARAYDPIPDDQAQGHWAKALRDYQKAAAHCIAGASAMDADLLQQSTREMGAGTTELQALTQRLKELQDAS